MTVCCDMNGGEGARTSTKEVTSSHPLVYYPATCSDVGGGTQIIYHETPVVSLSLGVSSDARKCSLHGKYEPLPSHSVITDE